MQKQGKKIFVCLITPLIIIYINAHLSAEAIGNNDFVSLYNTGKYKTALDIISGNLKKIYEARADNRIISSDYIQIKEKQDKKDINELFRNRKAKGFFIEENQELFNNHLYAARCSSMMYKYDSALNHYYQSLRFKPADSNLDSTVAYEIAQVYNKRNNIEAYHNFLEAACAFDPEKYQYSLELGKSLANTKNKKKAIYHIERYITSQGDAANSNLFLLIGTLYEEIERYLEAVNYYKKYLRQDDKNGEIYFSLGYLAYSKTGDYSLAFDCFKKSLSYISENDMFRRSKANEYMGDMCMKDLDFKEAGGHYLETVKYQNAAKAKIDSKEREISEINEQIRIIKSSLIKGPDFDKYNKYQMLQEKKGSLEQEKKEEEYAFTKLNAGKIRWNLAESFEKMKNPEEAIKYYRESITFNYNSVNARKKIIKLKLKIERGY